MKKITLLLAFLLLAMAEGRAQCIQEEMFPENVITAQNTGSFEQIAFCSSTTQYAMIDGIAIGADYTFFCNDGGTDKYITVTNWEDDVIAFGPAPLSVEDISSSQIKVHFSNNADCEGFFSCHDTGFQATLTCPIPINVVASGISMTGVTYTWEPGGSESEWQVLILPATDDAPEASDPGTTVTGEMTYSTTSLTPGMAYSFYIRANCGSEFSPWSPAKKFNTVCLPTTEFFQDFDDSFELPACWAVMMRNGTSNTSAQVADWTNVHSEPNFFEMNTGESTGDYDLFLISPNLSTLATGNHRVKFWAKGDADIEVGTIDGVSGDSTFSLIETVDLAEMPHQFTVDFSSYTGTDTFFAFRVTGDNFYSAALLDDIRWEVTPTCPDVTDVVLTGLTTSNVSIGWSPGGGETNWEVAYGPYPVEDPSEGTTQAVAGNPEVTLSGLLADTAYGYWIRSVCAGNDYGAWIGPYQFRTPCAPVATFFENFDSMEVETLTGCWSSILAGPSLSEYAQVQVVSWGDVHSEPNSVSLSASETDLEANDIILVSPNLSTLGNGTHRLKFWARGFDCDLQVGTLSGSYPGATFSLLEQVDLDDDPQEFTVDFSSYMDSDTFIGIRMTGSMYSDAYLDDIRWEVSPTCPDVTDVAINGVTPSGVTFSWMSQGDETQWNFAITAANVQDPESVTAQDADDTTATAGGLDANTDYNLWVRSVCAGSDEGAWIGPLKFHTDCEPGGDFFENFDALENPELPECWTSIISGPDADGYVESTPWGPSFSSPMSIILSNADASTVDNNIILVSPNLTAVGAGTHRVKFKSFGDSGTSLQIGTLDSNTETAVFTVLDEVTLNDEWDSHTVDFTTYTGTDRYFGFRLVAATQWQSAFIDDVRWEVAPACPDVTDILIENQTTTTADVSWSSNGSEASWQVVWTTNEEADPASFLDPANPATSNYTINGLQPSTTYFVWVRSICAGGENGAWIGPEPFDTVCVTASIASLEVQGFETTEDDKLPICWSGTILAGGEGWATQTVPFGDIENSASGEKIAYKNYPSSDALLISMPFSLAGVTDPMQVNMFLHRHGNAHPDDVYRVYISTTTSPDSGELIFEQFSSTDADPPVEDTGFYNYIAAIPETYLGAPELYIIVEGLTENGSDSYALGVDDFIVQSELGVQHPEKVTLRYFPNPVGSQLTIDASQDMTRVEVYNLLGQKILAHDASGRSMKLDVTPLAAGQYIVKVLTEFASESIKVIKK